MPLSGRPAGADRGDVGVRPSPVGVVGLIARMELPFSRTFGDALPALAAGNAAVDEARQQHAVQRVVGRLKCWRRPGPDWPRQVVAGSGTQLGPHLVDAADYVMFTGSSATGRTVAQRAGGRLIGSSMELGGKNAMIVLPDADPGGRSKVQNVVLFSNVGQLCISIERLFVHELIAQELTRRLVQRIGAMRLGTALDYSMDMGSLILVRSWTPSASRWTMRWPKGATVLTGGQASPDIGPYFFEPTLLSGVTEAMTSAPTRPSGRSSGVALPPPSKRYVGPTTATSD